MSEQEFSPTPLDGLFADNDSEIAATAAAVADEADTGVDEPSPGSGEEEIAETDAEAEAEAETEAEEDGSEEAQTVPLAALKAEREKYKRRIAELEAQQPQEDVKPPSVFEDEEGFNQNLDQRVQTAELRATLKLSKVMLAKEIGEDGVQDVWDKFYGYMQDNPRLEQEFAVSDHPFEYARQQVERYDMLQKIETGEIDQELERRVEQMLEEKLKGMEKQGETRVPRSLAGSAGDGVASNSFSGATPLDKVLALPD